MNAPLAPNTKQQTKTKECKGEQKIEFALFSAVFIEIYLHFIRARSVSTRHNIKKLKRIRNEIVLFFRAENCRKNREKSPNHTINMAFCFYFAELQTRQTTNTHLT